VRSPLAEWGKVRVSAYGTCYVPTIELMFSAREVEEMITQARSEAAARPHSEGEGGRG
jgi:hypothetical protein